jgi:hypothetical protein
MFHFLNKIRILPVFFHYTLKINPNSHCFIAIAKATACGWKEPLLPHPRHSHVKGRGKGGASSTALKICLLKTWVTLKLSSKTYWKLHFKWKPMKQKSLLRFFLRHFWFLKNILLQPSRTCFHIYKKGFLNSQGVRIRAYEIIYYLENLQYISADINGMWNERSILLLFRP